MTTRTIQGPIIWVIVTIGSIVTWWFSPSSSWLAQERVDKAFEGANVMQRHSVEGGDAQEYVKAENEE